MFPKILAGHQSKPYSLSDQSQESKLFVKDYTPDNEMVGRIQNSHI